LRLRGSYLRERSNTSSAGVKTEIQGVFNQPEWTAVLTGSYSRGPLSLSRVGRYTDWQVLCQTWTFYGTSTRWDVFNNHMGSTTLWDARIGYNLDIAGVNMSVFANVNNLFDKEPQEAMFGAFSAVFSSGPGLNRTGDLRGRRYVLGMNFDF